MKERTKHKHYIDLYRHEGVLCRADNDEPYPEYEGLGVIPGDEPACIVIEYQVDTEYERPQYDPPYPGGWLVDVELLDVWLEVGFRDSLKRHELPVVTQDVIWDACYDEVQAP